MLYFADFDRLSLDMSVFAVVGYASCDVSLGRCFVAPFPRTREQDTSLSSYKSIVREWPLSEPPEARESSPILVRVSVRAVASNAGLPTD